MLAAYLRGLLKPDSEFGTQSYLFEDVIFEAITADMQVQNFRLNVAADAAIVSILTIESKRDTMRRIQRQTQRQAELQLLDIYGLAAGIRKVRNAGSISLLQLFQLMKKEGIITPDEAAAAPET